MVAIGSQMTAYIYSNLTALSGQGLWSSLSPEASFLKDKTSYLPETDPRLPKHTLVQTFTTPQGPMTVANTSLVPATTGDLLGYLRIGADVWSYNTANSSGVFGLVPITSYAGQGYTAGTLVSVLGIR